MLDRNYVEIASKVVRTVAEAELAVDHYGVVGGTIASTRYWWKEQSWSWEGFLWKEVDEHGGFWKGSVTLKPTFWKSILGWESLTFRFSGSQF